MNHTTRSLSVLLAALLLARSGCGPNPAPASGSGTPAPVSSQGPAGSASVPETEPDPTPAAPGRSPTDNDHHFGKEGPFVWATGTEDLRYMLIGEFVGYFDAATGESGVLCGRPECTHRDYKCNAYVGSGAISLALYDGKLWWFGNNPQYSLVRGIPRQNGIWRMDPDGTNRELVKEFPAELAASEAVYGVTFHRGRAFFRTTKNTVTDGVPETFGHVYMTWLNDAPEFTLLAECPSGLQMEVLDRYVYVLHHAFHGDEEIELLHGAEVARYDIDTGERELLLSAEDAPELTAHLYVSDDGTVYLAENGTGRAESRAMRRQPSASR